MAKEECTDCGAIFMEGEAAYGTTLGKMTDTGFEMDNNEPWEEILCSVCYEHRKG